MNQFLDFLTKKIKEEKNVLTKVYECVRINELSVQKETLKKTLKKLKKVLDKVE